MNGNLFDSPAPSATEERLTAHCDGGSRGNPGPAGYGAVIEDAKGHVVAELSEFLGIQTNNYAEYHGLLGVLRWSVERNVKRLTVVSDSELMVKQMQGKYAVKSPVLKPLFEEARKLSRRIESFEMRHTLRGGNKTADRLANEAMDRGMGKSREQGAGIREPGRLPASSSALPGGAASGPNPGLGKPQPPIRPTAQATPYPVRQTLEGYVKDGVVHLLGGELPDGIFVKVIRE
jgi:probable phosphoglycerate mutase